ncbi:hypothetical protein KKH23_09245 [Patescibacteria group bacterium]|nr:hypothetical protein [Patescibacteria group bacterium]
MQDQKKINKITECIQEAERFIRKAEAWRDRLLTDYDSQYGCKESASAKRSSMDLSRVLTELRK